VAKLIGKPGREQPITNWSERNKAGFGTGIQNKSNASAMLMGMTGIEKLVWHKTVTIMMYNGVRS
jgi:hypothetical protein